MSNQLDLYKLVVDLVKTNTDVTIPELSFLNRYVLIRTDEEDLKTCNERDVEKVVYSYQQGNDLTFLDRDQKQLIQSEKDYGKTWLLINTNTIIGSMLAQSYDDLIKAIKNDVPHHLKDLVK